jgi:hypothetical protein
MINVQVDRLRFTFSASWQVSKYDDWAFYRRQFVKMWDGIKAVDLIALENQCVWLIEVKDYRTARRAKAIDLADEVAQKVFATLAALLPAKVNAATLEERTFAGACVNVNQLRVVLHLEQPRKHSKLFPRVIDPANVQLKLRTLIKPIDPHPKVVESTRMQGLVWAVQ